MEKRKNNNIGCIGAMLYIVFAICAIVIIISAMGGVFAIIAVVAVIAFSAKIIYRILNKILEIIKQKHNKSFVVEKAKERLDRANQLASIINSTYDFEEFIKSYSELIINMEFLQSIENLSFFSGRKPSEDLQEIKEKRNLTEKEFVDRYIYQYGKESLKSNDIYFDRLLPETVRYINLFLTESIPQSRAFNNFDYMEGHDFEYFCADILRKNGFENVEVTQGSGDQGIDILATKDGIKYGIQCKCYSSDIGNKAVQEAYSGKSFYDCHVSAVLTNRYFTKSAKELSEKNGVLLWDRDKLNEMIEKQG